MSSIVLLAVLLFSVGQGAADGDDETPVSIFHPSYLILAAGIFTAFIAGDLFNLYVGFEILLVASYVLITLGSTESRIRTGVVYIVVSLVSSILFLAAIAMIYGALGTVNMVQISERMAQLPPDTQLLLHLMLLLAFSIKAAVFPLSFWLPDSYPTAPAPVTAVFAGLLTKVGVYALIRTETQLFSDSDVNLLLMIVALATMIVGVLGAVAQAELKRILSFTLVSHVGYMVFGLAIATPAAIGATIYYMVHHIVVQTTLFLAIGLIERRAGSTSILRVTGLMRAAPVIAVLYFIPAINLGGLPPFSGFIGKFALFDAAAEVGTPIMIVLIVGGIVTSLLTLYALMRAWNLSFWREEQDSAETESRISYLGAAPAAGIKTERRVIPSIMTMTTAGMVGVTDRAHGLRGPPVRRVRPHRRLAPRARQPDAAAGGGRPVSPDSRQSTRRIAAQVVAAAALLRVARRAVDAALGPVHLVAFVTGRGGGGRRDARVPSAAGGAVGPGQPLVGPRLRARVPRRARARVAHGGLAGVRLPAAAGRRRDRGAAPDRRRPDHDAHGGDGIPHSRIPHHRRGPRPADPVPAHHRRAHRSGCRAPAREHPAVGGAHRARRRLARRRSTASPRPRRESRREPVRLRHRGRLRRGGARDPVADRRRARRSSTARSPPTCC